MTAKVRAIIVDDERLARKDLRAMLADHQGIEIVGEAGSVCEALEVIREMDPDLIFLDIQMPGESGFDLLGKTDLRARVIFVTAFDEYALRAFEVNAVDYLLKPVSPARLKAAVERVDGGERGIVGGSRLLSYEDVLLLTVNARRKFLRVSSIVCIQAAGDYSEVITNDGKKGLVQRSMSEWEQRLPERFFCRIHRSTIVNIDHVVAIEKRAGGAYQVCLKGVETPLIMSRRCAALLRRRRG